MDGIKAFNPPDVGKDDHIVRRLGWAVVRQWDRLPEAARERIREQAVFVEDGIKTAQLNEQIQGFIRDHKGGD